MSSGPEASELLHQILVEVHAIRVHMRRLARSTYLGDLNRIAKTPQRQEIWRLSDGSKSTREIAAAVKVSERAVQYFVEDGERLGLISSVRRGYPKRSEDFDETPGEWPPYRKPSEAPGESAGISTEGPTPGGQTDER